MDSERTPDDLPAFVETHFGSDKALGVHYVEWATGKTLSLEEGLNADPDLDLGSVFPDGTSATCCTNYAAQILKALPERTQIYGFANEDNPRSRIAREEIHPTGHDFAVIDGRYLVDPWIRLVAGDGREDRICFDLDDQVDAALVADTYGPRACWSLNTRAMEVAREMLAASSTGPANEVARPRRMKV